MGMPPPRNQAADKVSVADALFTKVQQRVLAVLYGNVDRQFFGSEIIRLAASGSGAVQRELTRLTRADLVTIRRVGRQKFYQANPGASVFNELRALVLKTSGLADQLRAALAPRAGDIRCAFVFGSVAKHEDTATSDIDLFVISDLIAYAELFALLEPVSAALGRTVNPTLYPTSEFETRRANRNAFVTRMLKQPRIWIVGDESELGT